MIIPKRLHPNFWRIVDKTGCAPAHVPAIGGCWNWTGSRSVYGYGYFSVYTERRRKAYSAHRISYAITQGEIPDGLCVLHKCDNRAPDDNMNLALTFQNGDVTLAGAAFTAAAFYIIWHLCNRTK